MQANLEQPLVLYHPEVPLSHRLLSPFSNAPPAPTTNFCCSVELSIFTVEDFLPHLHVGKVFVYAAGICDDVKVISRCFSDNQVVSNSTLVICKYRERSLIPIQAFHVSCSQGLEKRNSKTKKFFQLPSFSVKLDGKYNMNS